MLFEVWFIGNEIVFLSLVCGWMICLVLGYDENGDVECVLVFCVVDFFEVFVWIFSLEVDLVIGSCEVDFWFVLKVKLELEIVLVLSCLMVWIDFGWNMCFFKNLYVIIWSRLIMMERFGCFLFRKLFVFMEFNLCFNMIWRKNMGYWFMFFFGFSFLWVKLVIFCG